MEFELLLAVLAVVLGSIIQGVSGVGGGFTLYRRSHHVRDGHCDQELFSENCRSS